MNEIVDKKRKLPRHVDGRIMVGLMPLKNFFIILPIATVIIVLVIKYFSPAVFFIGALLLGTAIGMFSEFHQRETGFSLLRDIIRYVAAKDLYFERNIGNVSFSKRFTKFKAEGEKRKQE